ncbi:SusC/RagA family TonB-linked outer membrane protein [Pontibacter pudoricolor]|uniref:SusC/RagA family TonB-linked outer membrane protein n=1 Tax=Pontibacter pudoricolor TaxID=2694930 RepID=UPI00192E813D|nr:SusC/RagA family TonB-linked outer membrane protein [Pontibacter pudoricolor]
MNSSQGIVWEKVAQKPPVKTISLDMGKVTIQQAFNKIRSDYDVNFFYSDDELNVERKVNAKILNKNLLQAISILVGPNYRVEVSDDNMVVITPLKRSRDVTSAQDQVKIKGTITDEVGQPLPGVSIMVQGSTNGVISDTYGNYSLDVLPGDVLVFRFIGFETVEMPVSGRTELNLQMKPSVTQLSQVVVTGIYERKAESYTGSAVTITQEELKKVGNDNLFQSIRNIDPSIVIMDNLSAGSNPNALPEMQLRGTSTFPVAEKGSGSGLKGNYLKNPNQPLFILNGFEATAEQVLDLDINRVESVTLLKDAASKAIYGAKAANGVVVIETKRLSGSNTVVTYNGSLDVEMPDLTSYNLTNALEKLEAERIDGMYTPNSNDPEEYIRLQQLYNARKKLALEGLDTYWMAKPLQTGFGQRHSASVELGGQDLRMLANVAYRDIVGVMKGSSRQNISGSLTTSYRLKNLAFRNIMSANKNNAQESPYGTFDEYAKMNPYWRAEAADGSIPYYAEIGPNGERYTNPLFNSTLDSKIASSYFNFTDNFYLEWSILPELRAVARVGIDVKNNDADEFYPSAHTSFEGFVGEDMGKRKGSYQLNNGESSYLSGDLNINYSKEVNKHFYFANLGFNISENKFNEVVHRVEGFPSSRMDDVIFGRAYALESRPTGINGISRDIGFLAVGSYTYDNRFLSDLTLRTSASSQFGTDKRWAKFWSFGLGWNLHNEHFIGSNVFDLLKVRGSLGSTGQQNFNTNASIATYNYYLESLYQGFTGSYLENMANSGLQWETKFDYNVGVDARIKNLSARLDYYENYTENLITDMTIANSSGFSTVKDNIGRVKNAGYDLNASYLVWSHDRNFFSLNFGLVTNKNEIVELSNAMKSYNEAMDVQAAERGNNKPIHKYQDGMSMDAIWAVRSLGIDPSTGNEVYLDRFGNTTFNWDAKDMMVVGNSNPKYRGNFGLSAEHSGIGLNVTFRYLGGGQMYNQTLVDKVENVDMNYNVDKRVLTGRWLYPGQNALYKRLGDYTVDTGEGYVVSHAEKTRATSRFVQDRNELDIAAVNLYYDFNTDMLKRLGMERLKLSLNMNEVANISTIRIERGTSYPFARTLSFSALATF